LPDNEKIEFLANKFMNELISQGHDVSGSNDCEYLSLFSNKGALMIRSNNCEEIRVKRAK